MNQGWITELKFVNHLKLGSRSKIGSFFHNLPLGNMFTLMLHIIFINKGNEGE